MFQLEETSTKIVFHNRSFILLAETTEQYEKMSHATKLYKKALQAKIGNDNFIAHAMQTRIFPEKNSESQTESPLMKEMPT